MEGRKMLCLKYYWLAIKVFILRILIRLRIKENVWHQCELDLAKIQAEKIVKLFTELDKDFDRSQRDEQDE
jgi:hypothetical protein